MRGLRKKKAIGGMEKCRGETAFLRRPGRRLGKILGKKRLFLEGSSGKSRKERGGRGTPFKTTFLRKVSPWTVSWSGFKRRGRHCHEGKGRAVLKRGFIWGREGRRTQCCTEVPLEVIVLSKGRCANNKRGPGGVEGKSIPLIHGTRRCMSGGTWEDRCSGTKEGLPLGDT